MYNYSACEYSNKQDGGFLICLFAIVTLKLNAKNVGFFYFDIDLYTSISNETRLILINISYNCFIAFLSFSTSLFKNFIIVYCLIFYKITSSVKIPGGLLTDSGIGARYDYRFTYKTHFAGARTVESPHVCGGYFITSLTYILECVLSNSLRSIAAQWFSSESLHRLD